MNYQVSARKHRPMSFPEVSGQPHVVRTLTNAITSGRTAHAYLFSGMRGVGKTTMARILAKALNCEQGPTASPCLTCPNCREISQGTSFDVLEIDGASSNSVDDVREMRETIKTAPARGRYRVYIIDEVHMLSTAAFNALLKTLEEPPSHVVFLFATTESHKIPPTILSRCQQFTFRRIARREIMDHLQRVAVAEGLSIDERSLSALARASDGSMRDALSLLDQAVAFGGKQVTSEVVTALLGSVPRELLRAVLVGILEHDAGRALRALAEVQDRGSDLRQFCGELVECMRHLLVAKMVPDSDDLIELAPEEQAEIKADAARLTLPEIQELSKVFLQAEDGLRASQHPWFVVELAVVRACQPTAKAVAAGEPRAPAPTPAPSKGSPDPPPAAVHAAPPKGREVAALSKGEVGGRAPAKEVDWEAVVSRVSAERSNAGAYLEETTLVGRDGDLLTIGHPVSAGASIKIILREEYQRLIMDACQAVTGRSFRLRFVPLDGTPAPPTVAQRRREQEAAATCRLHDAALTSPLLQEALAVFAGEVKEVRRNHQSRSDGTHV